MPEKYMTAEEKGYECPGLEDCTQCEFYTDLCIIYGKTGKKKLKKRINELEKFFTKIVSEENLFGLSVQMSLLTLRLQTVEDGANR